MVSSSFARRAFSACTALTLAAGLAPATAGEFEGVTVNIMTFTGPQIAEPLQRRAPDFEKLTGAKINVIIVPFSDLYQKLLTDWAAGTNSIDAARVRAAVDGRLRTPAYLEDLIRPRRQGQRPAGGRCRAVLPRFLAEATTARPT